MDNAFKKFLEEHRKNDVFHSHVSMLEGSKGKFLFSRKALEIFWKLYDEEIKQGNPVGIAEKRLDYSPVVVDIDIKLKEDTDKEIIIMDDSLYSDEQVKSIVSIYQKILKENLQDCPDEDLFCVVLEKSMYIKTQGDDTFYKHGFHLHFPSCFIKNIDYEVMIYPKVIEEMKKENIFENIGIFDPEKILDKGSFKNAWLLYGSRKSIESQPYKVTKIYDINLEELDLEDALGNYTIYDHKENVIDIKGNVEHYLPRILSINPFGRSIKETKKGLACPKPKVFREKKEFKNESLEEIQKKVVKYVPLLSPDRAGPRLDWLTVGWALYNIFEGSEEGYELWIDFSAKCPEKFDEAVCYSEWAKMTVRNELGIGTIKYFAKIDSPIEYYKIVEEELQHYVKTSLFTEGSDYDIACILHSQYKGEFVTTSIDRTPTWYRFNGIWQRDEGGVTLYGKISSEICERFAKVKAELHRKIADMTDPDEKTEQVLAQAIKNVSKIYTRLRNNPAKNRIMKECAMLFYDKDFKEKLNSNPYLFPFKNGVYDLRENVFRPGRPEDYISRTAGCDYIQYDGTENEVQEVYTFLMQIFPDKTLYDYFLNVYCDVFVGGNQEKTVIFWIGEGDNGKTVMQQFFEIMLGRLAIKLNTPVLTGKKPSAGNAQADMARAGDGVRWVVLEEPDGNESINSGIYKAISGGDTIFARDLYEAGKDTREIKPMFKVCFICNKLPPISNAGTAVWNRTRVLPFESLFCRENVDCPKTFEEQLIQKRFPRDNRFSEKIPKLVSAFAWVLLNHRKKNNPKIDPPKVIAATEFYRKQNDIFKQYIEEMVVEEESKSLPLTILYDNFKAWFTASFPRKEIPVRSQIEEYFTLKWGQPSSKLKAWKGYRMRTASDDSDIVVIGEEPEDDVTNLL